jgi:hypothetical protein
LVLVVEDEYLLQMDVQQALTDGGAAKGDGHPVLVLPGLMAGDDSTMPLRIFLKGRGYAVSGWGLGVNRGLRDGVQERLLDLVHDFSDVHGRKISVVG